VSRSWAFRWKLLSAPLRRAPAKTRLAGGALMLAAALVTALGTINGGVEGSLSRQFRRYGANLVGMPANGPLLPLAAATGDAVGVRYIVAEAGGQSIAIAGADVARLRALNRSWEVSGAAPAAGECWLGVNAARPLHISPGGELRLALGGRSAAWRVAGTVSSGGAEDDQVLAPYAQVAALSGREGYTTLELHVDGSADAMQAAIGRLQVAAPAARWQPVLQVAEGETRILRSTRAMVAATSGLILLTVLLCVTAALATQAVGRRRDFALMRALGAGEAAVAAGFAGEAALLGLAAAAPGILLGGVAAGAMGEALFGVWLWPAPWVVAAAFAIPAAVAGVAALLPWPILHAATPAALLRGE
jgi:putative ABC transport system permease protein